MIMRFLSLAVFHFKRLKKVWIYTRSLESYDNEERRACAESIRREIQDAFNARELDLNIVDRPYEHARLIT